MPRLDLSAVLPRLPLVFGQLLVGTTALAAITLTINEPGFSLLIHLTLIAGFALSFLGLLRGRHFPWPGVLIVLIAFVLYALRTWAPPPVLIFYPAEVLAHEDMLLATLVAWFLVAFSFWQSSRANFIFCVVCALAIFGLMGTVNLNLNLWLDFITFVFAVVFCWGYEQYLDLDDRLAQRGQVSRLPWHEVLRGQLAVALLVSFITLSVGTLFGWGAYAATPNLYSRMAVRVYGWDITRMFTVNYQSFEEEFHVGVGPINLSSNPVVRIKADYPALWRGMVYVYYDGHGWARNSSETLRVNAGNGLYAYPTEFRPPGATRVNRQQVRAAVAPGLVLGASQPMAVVLPAVRPELGAQAADRRKHLTLLVDSFGCANWQGATGESFYSYRVTSLEPVADEGQLRAAGRHYPSWMADSAYLDVPVGTRLELEALVNRITAEAATPYDKMMALETYLADECVYSLNAPATPRGQDVAAYFVTKSRRGACDQFSTALALMGRLAGVPTRLATGFATGTYDSTTGEYVVLGTDAHAWVEVYFPRLGWVPFDPQASRSEGGQPLAQLLANGHWSLLAAQTAHTVGYGLLVAVLLILAASALVDPLRLLRDMLAPRSHTPLQRLAHDYQRLLTTLVRQMGLSPARGSTPRQVVGLLAARHPQLVDLLPLNERFYQVRYAAAVSPEELAALARELTAFRQTARRLRRS
jgi:hypothetical protein